MRFTRVYSPLDMFIVHLCIWHFSESYMCVISFITYADIYIHFLNMCQLKSRKHSAKSPKANCIWPKEIHEKVSALNITTPLLERESSRWTPRVRTRRSTHDALCAETPWLAIKKIRDGSSFRLFSRNVPSSFATPFVFLQKVSLLAPTCCRTQPPCIRNVCTSSPSAQRDARYALRSVCLRFLTAKMHPRKTYSKF